VPACTTETEAQRQPCYGEILSILGAFSPGSPVEHPTERLAALTGLPQSVVREVLLRPGSSQERLGWLADLLNVRRLRPQEFDARKEVIEATQRLRDVSLDAARKTQAVEAATNPTQKAQAVQALAAAVQQTQTVTADLERKTQTLGALLQASQRPQVATMSRDVAQKAQAASVAAGTVRDLQGVAIAGDAARQRQLVGAAEDVVRQTQAMDSAATAMALGQIR
jgi:hypothetical protein